MRSYCVLTAFAFAFMFSMGAGAAPTEVHGVDGDWDNPDGWPDGLASLNYYSGVTVAYGNGSQDQIRWGARTGTQSGLGFTGAASPMTVVTGDPFAIGQLAHFNNPIGAYTSITSVDLTITLSLAGIGDEGFTFELGIEETPNSPGPPRSNDIISFPNSYSLHSFDMDGTPYTLQLLGFGSSASNILRTFSSPEGGTQTTLLWGQITEPQVVPVPGALLLATLGVGLVRYLQRPLGDRRDRSHE
ncbi:MAG: hypothetical protein GXY19_18250 [Phycisphaerae bacterium]|nr:hypothetical protein [Phycisphaerae bacterium]